MEIECKVNEKDNRMLGRKINRKENFVLVRELKESWVPNLASKLKLVIILFL